MPETATTKAVEEIEKTPEEESSEEPKPEKPKSGGLLQTVIIIAITQIITLAGAFFFVKMYLVPKVTVEGKAVEEIVPQEREPAQIHMIEDLVVNPAGTNGTRYLSATIGLEYAKAIESEKSAGTSGGYSAGAVRGMGNKEPVIRDILIAILTSKNIQQLSSAEGKEALRAEIMEKINYEVAPDTVYKVYLVDYVLQ
ncbi:MAG: flagellar basal body-associated FliL family protein [Candidatus Zixiibacteriota bacterium]|nr:MAG: flagellar basal body-associated FliL family protein [candidate division Zixibacteria bacterium]